MSVVLKPQPLLSIGTPHAVDIPGGCSRVVHLLVMLQVHDKLNNVIFVVASDHFIHLFSFPDNKVCWFHAYICNTTF